MMITAGVTRFNLAEIAIVGFDDFEFARDVDPPLTIVGLPGYEMGGPGRRSVPRFISAVRRTAHGSVSFRG